MKSLRRILYKAFIYASMKIEWCIYSHLRMLYPAMILKIPQLH